MLTIYNSIQHVRTQDFHQQVLLGVMAVIRWKLIPCEQRIAIDYDHINKISGENIFQLMQKGIWQNQIPVLEKKKQEKNENSSTWYRVHLFPMAAAINDHKLEREIYSLSILQAKSPKSGCQWGFTPSSGSWREASLASCSFWWLVAFFGLLGFWPHHSNLCLHFFVTFSSVGVVCFFLCVSIL